MKRKLIWPAINIVQKDQDINEKVVNVNMSNTSVIEFEFDKDDRREVVNIQDIK